MEKENPIKRIRKEREISQQELAILADVAINTVRNSEKGLNLKLNDKILEALDQLGYEKEQVRKEYETWRKELKQDIIDRKGKDANE